ncbi:adenylyltransferase and sulfurtransferase MOCS3-like, partial [Ctenocephalides felis]|uniref:adenylyltransferase and sulfurtransferase MOCS3-like n=1 Tax=Ctenocephalides felis TaxID=7515 RepID=UPI000E6E2A8D
MSLDEEIKKVQDEVHDLQRLLFEKEKALNELRRKKMLEDAKSLVLDKSDIERYSRQILVPDHGMENQLKLKKTSVLIVGAGGLGCPAAMYLTGAGVGTIGLLDHDVIEITNLHRQLLHNESSLGRSKVDSAINSLSRLNSTTNFIKHETLLTSTNAMDIIKDYDLVLDCTDNVATRYLLNDCCILLKRPLISEVLYQMEGQLTVYGYRNGPCYRCIFPVPPPPETVTNCGDGGVIPTVPGVIGVLQAVEAIKLITDKPTLSGRLLLYYAADSAFRNIKLRGKSKL